MEKKKIVSFTDLEAWKQAHVLLLLIYKLTKKFPREELFGLINQIRRAIVSVTSNLAEGFRRGSYREKAQFYSVAHGSLTEVENQLIISKDLGYISEKEFQEASELQVNVSKLISGLIRKTKTFI